MRSVVIIEGSTVHALVFFPANGLMNPDFFSLKLSAPQGESSLKISAHYREIRFVGDHKQTRRQTAICISKTFYILDAELQGPFSSTKMLEWVESGYFKEPVWCR